MKEVKSPDSVKAKKHTVELPPQQSATDTSNWEDRNVSAPSIDKITKKRTVRDVSFNRPKRGSQADAATLTLAQLEKLEAKKRTKKSSK